MHHARLATAHAIAAGVVEYRFTLDAEDAGLTWRSGQFISISIGATEDGTPILRSYSLASRPDGAGFRLVLKLVPGGVASEWFRRLQPGDRVRFTGPMGFFVLDLQPHPGDIVFAATGTGLAPFVPMIEDLLERGDRGPIHLFFGVREEADVFWRGELARLEAAAAGRLRVEVALSRPAETEPWAGARGRITPRLFERLPALLRPTFYLCGNGAMIREVKAGLVERGVDRKRQIRTEAFFD